MFHGIRHLSSFTSQFTDKVERKVKLGTMAIHTMLKQFKFCGSFLFVCIISIIFLANVFKYVDIVMNF